VRDLADVLGVTEKSVNRWGNDDSPIPERAWDALDALEDGMQRGVESALDLARAHPRTPVTLYRYRSQEALDASPHGAGMPLGAHAMMIGWAYEALEADGIEVDMDWA